MVQNDTDIIGNLVNSRVEPIATTKLKSAVKLMPKLKKYSFGSWHSTRKIPFEELITTDCDLGER